MNHTHFKANDEINYLSWLSILPTNGIINIANDYNWYKILASLRVVPKSYIRRNNYDIPKYLNIQKKRAQEYSLESEAIKLLVLELSNMDGATFFANLNQEIPDDLKETLDKAIDKYLIEKIPVQHIIGYSYFYGYKMKVSDQVLIPRPETEELVGYVLQTYDEVFDGKRLM